MGTGPVSRVMTVLLQVDMFEASLQPGASLLQDWLTSAHHTQLAVEMVVAGLETLGRGDVAAVIREERGEEEEAAQVFISYQWDNQEEALRVRQYLEQVYTTYHPHCRDPHHPGQAAISCWMDVGQLGGGDGLYQRVYQAISQSRVLVACLSPRYLVSAWCAKELLLADLLHKPIVPVYCLQCCDQSDPCCPGAGGRHPLAAARAPRAGAGAAGLHGPGGGGRARGRGPHRGHTPAAARPRHQAPAAADGPRQLPAPPLDPAPAPSSGDRGPAPDQPRPRPGRLAGPRLPADSRGVAAVPVPAAVGDRDPGAAAARPAPAVRVSGAAGRVQPPLDTYTDTSYAQPQVFSCFICSS